jgi:hypothetical protein
MKTASELRKLCDRYNFVWATRRVAEDGAPVSCMLRKNPNNALPSSGWFFLSKEDEDGIESAEDIQMCSIERVLSHSPAVAAYLHLPPGSRLEAHPEGMFSLVKRGREWWEFWRREKPA